MRHSGSVSRLMLAVLAVLMIAAYGQAQVKAWVTRYDNGANDDDQARAIALMPDSGVVVTGMSWQSGGSGNAMATVRMSATGQKLWDARYYAGVSTHSEGLAVAVDEDGNVFVAGKIAGTTITDYVTAKYDSEGNEQWVKTYRSGNLSVAVAVVPDRLGGCFVTGYSRGTRLDYMTFHYRADGEVAWSARRPAPGPGDARATAMALSEDGRLYVTGYAFVSLDDSFDYVTVEYDTATGNELWASQYDGTGEKGVEPKADYAFGMALDVDGNVHVVGRAGENGTGYDAVTVKYTPDGAESWVNRMHCRLDTYAEGASAIAVDAAGRVFCGGFTTEYYEDSWLDMLVYCINPAGTTEWFQVYNFRTDLDDSTVALGIDENSNVYIVGYSESTTSTDPNWAVMKYSPDGDLLWFTMHGGNNYAEPAALAIDPRGEPIVTGYDMVRLDNEDYAIVKFSEADAGAGLVLSPADTLRYDAVMKPRVRVHNLGSETLTFPVRCEIGAVYTDGQFVIDLGPYDSTEVEFKEWQVRDIGTLPIRVFTQLSGDKDPLNDTSYGSVVTVAVWEQLASLPGGPRERPVKDGGALAFVRDSLVYAFKGNNTPELYAYNTRAKAWSEKTPVPEEGRSGKKKRVKKGARLEWDGNKRLYALKGNSTFEFWRLSLDGDTGWVELEDYPIGMGKKVKYGTGLVYVPAQNRIYSCKGSNTFEFHAYDVATKQWIQKKDVPGGVKNKKCKDGTSIAFDGNRTIYLIKGGRYEFYAYDIILDEWSTKKELRDAFYTTKKRKVKGGAALAWDTEESRLYATKGGKLSEFWYFDPARDSWIETPDTIPRDFRTNPPYHGSTMEYGNGKLYFLRGNKTLEFWTYHANFPVRPGADGSGPQQAESVEQGPALRLQALPNPFLGSTVISFSVPKAGRTRLAVYDASGRCVEQLVDGWRAPGDYAVGLRGLNLAAGVYLARLEVGDGNRAAVKLVVSR